MLTSLLIRNLYAERPRFELGIPFWGIHAFQACLFSHSSIAPFRECKGRTFGRILYPYTC